MCNMPRAIYLETSQQILVAAYKPIACTNCGKLHKVQFLSRILASLLLVGSIFAFNLVSYPTSTQAFILAVLVIIPANILVLPYLMRYRLA
ncbi:hypothetical protein [Planococcus antarcticus]|uniref:hypothetical protein n=1 Tax=Planococcus antarcticus TaxID=161360 RepID=UPI0012B5B22F|nr:hypothetical protein [Planococcus antarcticus]